MFNIVEKPQPIEYTTPQGGHKVTLSNLGQLVVKQGFTCIDGGKIKHDGKYVQLMIRYDNKPELARQIATWQEQWESYNNWFAQEVAAAKESIVFSPDRDQAENDAFSWSRWDGTSGKTLTDKSSGREIYQMRYTDKSEPITGSEKTKVMIFWKALDEAKNDPVVAHYTPEETKASDIQQEQHPSRNDHPGWCNHCHSYCYGDCQA